jgi:hypothetical protein
MALIQLKKDAIKEAHMGLKSLNRIGLNLNCNLKSEHYRSSLSLLADDIKIHNHKWEERT